MSRYSTFVLSFNSEEFDETDDDDPELLDCEPVRKIDAWLKRKHYSPLMSLNNGMLASNVVLFAGTFNKINVDLFMKYVLSRKWKYRSDLRLLYWGEEDDVFTYFEPSGQSEDGS